MLRQLILLVLIISTVVSCEVESDMSDHEDLQGVWLGGGNKMDIDYYRPFGDVMFLTEDHVNYLSAPSDSLTEYSVSADTFYLKKIFPLNFSKKGENLGIGYTYKSIFHKIKKSENLVDTSDLRDLLISNTWKLDHQYYEFSDDSLLIYNSSDKSIRKLCWGIKSRNDYTFIDIHGSATNCESPQYPLMYVPNMDDTAIDVTYWKENEFRNSYFRKENIRKEDYSFPDFQLCNPFINRRLARDRFYFKYTSYEGGSRKLLDIFQSKYRPQGLANVNAIIKVGFVVNCTGQVGQVKLVTMNKDYKEIKLDDKITDQIITIFGSLGPWAPGEFQGHEVDTYKYILIRFNDGQITDISL